jgi:diaminohydroxyphosphoribosylaminopyrimidine deaminase/5-amino-6-(5-phosphoribosylamino)uracil reductase
LITDQQYLYRCLELAKLGAGNVAPNPMVGAVLVYKDKIIGEGFHRQFGQAHAEVNCINEAIQMGNAALISQATLYVSLEPCNHFGKTPPCTDLIIASKIPKVVIGCRDPHPYVDGKGIEKLSGAGIDVRLANKEMEQECIELNKRFFCFQLHRRPYIILKWAESADGIISAGSKERTLISNEYSNRLVHKWRSEEASIFVGANTVLSDDPELTTRLWPGNSPVRLVADPELKIPASLNIFNKKVSTIIFNTKKECEEENLKYYRIKDDENLLVQIMEALFRLQIQSVLVEGGAKLIQSFIDEKMWDEARVIKNIELKIGKGLAAPVLRHAKNTGMQKIFSDTIETYQLLNN